MSDLNASPLRRKLMIFVAVMAGVGVPLRASGTATEQAAMALSLVGAIGVLIMDANVRERLGLALKSTLGRLIGFMLFTWAVGIPFSFAPWNSLQIGSRTGLLILATTLIWAVLADNERVRLISYRALLIASFIATALVILSMSGVPLAHWILKGAIVEHIQPRPAFKAFAVVTMCLVPVVIWTGHRLGGWWRWGGYVYGPMALAVIVQTYNRSALAGFLAMSLAVLILLALSRHRRTKVFLVTASALATVVILWIKTREKGAVALDGAYLPGWLIDPHRQYIWKFAFERFLDHPLVGNGIDQLNYLPNAAKSVPGLDSTAAFVPSHPHNGLLEIGAETGLLGLLPMLAVLAYITWRLIRRYRASQDSLSFTQLVLMAGFWGSALFNFSIWAVWWQLTFLMLFTLIEADKPLSRPQQSP